MYRTICLIISATSLHMAAYHKTTLLQFEPYATHDYTLDQFLEPVTFTSSGFAHFFTHHYNTQRYAQEFLPCCFVHVLDFVAHARTTKDPVTFAIASFDIFHQRLKDATWVNPYALLMLLEHLPDNVATLCQMPDQERTYRKILHDAILHEFNILKEDPDRFLDRTATSLVSHDEDRRNREQIQQRVTRFIESALDKLIWSPHEQTATWHSMTALAKQLEYLYQYGIIPDETSLNHLLWSLIYRYGHFLEYAGDRLSEEAYTQIRDELKEELSWLTYEEIESHMTDKREYLMDALARGYARSVARKQRVT